MVGLPWAHTNGILHFKNVSRTNYLQLSASSLSPNLIPCLQAFDLKICRSQLVSPPFLSKFLINARSMQTSEPSTLILRFGPIVEDLFFMYRPCLAKVCSLTNFFNFLCSMYDSSSYLELLS